MTENQIVNFVVVRQNALTITDSTNSLAAVNAVLVWADNPIYGVTTADPVFFSIDGKLEQHTIGSLRRDVKAGLVAGIGGVR